jgi:hypothetical protein
MEQELRKELALALYQRDSLFRYSSQVGANDPLGIRGIAGKARNLPGITLRKTCKRTWIMPGAISDSSTLMHLSMIGRLNLLQEFFGEISVPGSMEGSS